MGKTIDFKKAAAQKERRQEDELWQELIDCIDKIRALKPWKLASEGAPFVYIPKSADRIIVSSYMRDVDGSRGVITFPSLQEYDRAQRPLPSRRQSARAYIEQEACMVFWGERDDVPRPLREVYRRLSLHFEDGQWPRVLCKRRGCLEAVPQGREIGAMLENLGNFCMQLRALQERASRPDFEDGDMLLRIYSPQDQLWLNMVRPFVSLPLLRRVVTVRDESPSLQHLRTLPRAQEVRRVELDYGWIDAPNKKHKGEAPCFPAAVVMTDRQTGEVLGYYTCGPEELMDCAFALWEEVLCEHGIPETLYVCRDETDELFEDMTQKLGVKLKRVKKLPAAESLLRECGAV